MSLKMFIPITKVDEDKHLVYGIATAEAVDKVNEVFDYEGSKPYYEKWSGDIAKATDGKSLGNVRAMHSKIAAGKLTNITFNDTEKQIEICAKIVDENEWLKVKEGVYTGFSQGGNYVKTWKDPENPELTRYIADPVEISIVDNPCLPGATFQVIKADGTTLAKAFTSVVKEEPAEEFEPKNDDIIAKAKEMAKAAGDESKYADHIEAARAELIKAAKVEPAADEPAKTDPAPNAPSEDLEQVWKARDGQTFKKKADAIAHNESLDKTTDELGSALASLTKTIEAKENPQAEVEEIAKVDEPAPKTEEPKRFGLKAMLAKSWKAAVEKDAALEQDQDAKSANLAKGLNTVGRLASLIVELDWLCDDTQWEAEYEGDNSPVPAQLKEQIAALCETLRAMVAEETAELTAEDGVVVEIFEAAAGMVSHGHFNSLVKVYDKSDALNKAGARNSKSDKQRIQKMHDLSGELGAECAKDEAEKVTSADLEKVTKENDTLKKQISDALPVISALKERVEKLESQPMPTRGRPVEKHEDAIDEFAKNAVENPNDAALQVIKAAQKFPQQVFRSNAKSGQ